MIIGKIEEGSIVLRIMCNGLLKVVSCFGPCEEGSKIIMSTCVVIT